MAPPFVLLCRDIHPETSVLDRSALFTPEACSEATGRKRYVGKLFVRAVYPDKHARRTLVLLLAARSMEVVDDRFVFFLQ